MASLELAALSVLGTMVLLVPTMVWVHLRVPRLRRTLEVVCLLPLTIPAIVLVVGIAPIYKWVTYFLGGSPLTLTFVYMVLVLPFAHRAIDASLRSVDVVTLSEAARTLGASWRTDPHRRHHPEHPGGHHVGGGASRSRSYSANSPSRPC